MRATWRPLAAWPYPKAPAGRGSFRAGWTKTLNDLDREIELAGGDDPIIGVVAGDEQFSLSGVPRANFRVKHPGAEVSFARKDGRRLAFHTDAFGSFAENLRAISLGLTALRAINRYAIASGAEQYAGFAQIGPGGPSADRGKLLVAQAGSIRKALLAHHPDHGGDPVDFAAVQAYRDAVGAR